MWRIIAAAVCLLLAIAGITGNRGIPEDAEAAYIAGVYTVPAVFFAASIWLFVTGLKGGYRRRR